VRKQGNIKIIILGHSNVGKTSIAKYLKYLNRALALDTEPSTRIEKYTLNALRTSISIFVTPGQKRFRRKNREFLYEIIDSNTIIYYVIDASAETSRLKLMIKDYMNLVLSVDKLMKNRTLKGIAIALLVHKQDLPQAIDGEKIFGEFISKLRQRTSGIGLYVFNTSIYWPETLLRVLRETVFSKIFPMDSLNSIIGTIKQITGSEIVVISDTMGFPIAVHGDSPLATWLSVFPAKIMTSLDQERNMMREYQKDLWVNIFNAKENENTSIDMILETPNGNKIYFHMMDVNGNFLCLSLFNPKNSLNIVRETAKNFTEKIYNLFNITQGF